MPYLPPSPEGYGLNLSSATVHRRYAEHDQPLRRCATPTAVYNLLGARDPQTCAECFPTPKAEKPKGRKSRKTQERVVETFEDAERLPDAVTLATEAGYDVETISSQTADDPLLV